MKTSPYESIRTFELSTDVRTKLVVEVSARGPEGRRMFRIGTFRSYFGPDGAERRSPFLGKREMKLKQGLERSALEFVRDLEREQRITRQGDRPVESDALPAAEI